MLMSKKLLTLALLLGSSLCAAGSLTTANYYYWWTDSWMPADSYGVRTYTCPSTYPRIISGNCGHRDANVLAQTDIVVNYSGAAIASGAETRAWRCLADNRNLSSGRTLRVGLICGK
jgi:hypothetical protein